MPAGDIGKSAGLVALGTSGRFALQRFSAASCSSSALSRCLPMAWLIGLLLEDMKFGWVATEAPDSVLSRGARPYSTFSLGPEVLGAWPWHSLGPEKS